MDDSWPKWPNIPCGQNDLEYRGQMHPIIQGIKEENFKLMLYLCRDIISHNVTPPSFVEFLRHLEKCKKIGCHNVSLLAEILYRISRIDLLKKLIPMSKEEFEDRYLRFYCTHFTPFRLLMFELHDDLGVCDFMCLKHQFSSYMKRRAIDETSDVISLLIKVEELGVVQHDDFSDLVEILRLLDNPDPFKKFVRLKEKDWSVLLPMRFQMIPQHQGITAFNNDIPMGKHSQFESEHGHNTYHWNHKEMDLPNERHTISPPEVRYNFGSQGAVELQFEHVPNKPHFGSTGKSFIVHQNEIELDKKAQYGYRNRMTSVQSQPVYYQYPPQNLPHSSSTPNYMYNMKNPWQRSSCPDMTLPTLQQIPHGPPQTSYYIEQKSENLSREMGMLNLTEDYNKTNSIIGRYKIGSKPGICLLINNEKFEDNRAENFSYQHEAGSPQNDLTNRDGSSIDADSLTEVFTGFGFQVHRFDNLSCEKMQETLQLYAQMDHSEYDCFACAILSHGKRNTVYSVDGYKIKISEIQGYYTATASLTDKPKLFFIQACAGTQKMECEGVQPTQEEVQNDGSTPILADFLLAHATSPGYLSYRSTKFGSFFIMALTKNLKRYWKTEDLLSIVVKATDDVSKHKQGNAQVPMPSLTLRKKVFFQMLPEYQEKFQQEIAIQNYDPTTTAVNPT